MKILQYLACVFSFILVDEVHQKKSGKIETEFMIHDAL